MAQAIKEVKKLGAKNKIINLSVREVMPLISQMREERLAKELAERKEAIAAKQKINL